MLNDSTPKYFEDGKEIICFKNEHEMLQKLKDLDVFKAKQVGRAGMKKVYENYTWNHTIRKIMDIADAS